VFSIFGYVEYGAERLDVSLKKLDLSMLTMLALFFIYIASVFALSMGTVSLILPPNNSWISGSNDTIVFVFNYTGESIPSSCELVLGNRGYGMTGFITSGMNITMYANSTLNEGTHLWYVNCTNTTSVQSEKWTLNIGEALVSSNNTENASEDVSSNETANGTNKSYAETKPAEANESSENVSIVLPEKYVLPKKYRKLPVGIPGHEKVRIGHRVAWLFKAAPSEFSKLVIPWGATDISIMAVYGDQFIPVDNYTLSDARKGFILRPSGHDGAELFIASYSTEPPKLKEKKEGKYKKLLIVESDLHYENVEVTTALPTPAPKKGRALSA